MPVLEEILCNCLIDICIPLKSLTFVSLVWFFILLHLNVYVSNIVQVEYYVHYHWTSTHFCLGASWSKPLGGHNMKCIFKSLDYYIVSVTQHNIIFFFYCMCPAYLLIYMYYDWHVLILNIYTNPWHVLNICDLTYKSRLSAICI